MNAPTLPRYLSSPPRPEARFHLYCFPHAGGGATLFYPWSRSVPSWLQVLPIHLPGRESRHAEPTFTDLDQLVADLEVNLSPILRPPFAFFGHSLGALIAFELARRLSVPPDRLFVSSSRAPQLPRRGSPLSQLPDAEFLTAMQERYQALPAVVLADREVLTHFLAILRADFTLFDAYQYRPGQPLPSPITVYGGEEDREVSAESLAGWSEQTTSAFRLRMFNGDHFYLKTRQAELLEAIIEALA
jgi:medium-chain acyl-[acyl-carrier-protein] hydrolase